MQVNKRNLLYRIQWNTPPSLGPMSYSPDGHIVYYKTGTVQDMSTQTGYSKLWEDPEESLTLHLKYFPLPNGLQQENGIFYISWVNQQASSRQLRLSIDNKGAYSYRGAITQRCEAPEYSIIGHLGSYSLKEREIWEAIAKSVEVTRGMTSLGWMMELLNKAIAVGLLTKDKRQNLLLSINDDMIWRGMFFGFFFCV
ncbi:hypothetical protein QCA50_006948 [Cerrena zonata]|uniref:Uncharacterized protein n=1 Tax=Cerrena zonata TaxID=2478898 RepID=A0AAW0GCY7_9APHY